MDVLIYSPYLCRASHPNPGGYLHGPEIRIHGGYVLFLVDPLLCEGEVNTAESRGQRAEGRRQAWDCWEERVQLSAFSLLYSFLSFLCYGLPM